MAQGFAWKKDFADGGSGVGVAGHYSMVTPLMTLGTHSRAAFMGKRLSPTCPRGGPD